MRRFLLVIVLLGGLACVAIAQDQPKRIALVIGNTNYEWKTPLDNAVLDAQKISKRLGQLHFDVDDYYDLNHKRLRDALTQFGAKIKALGPNVITFFYYSGHAAQDLAQINYLIPTDADAEGPDKLREQAVPLQQLFRDMAVANNAVNIVVLDACRDWFAGDTSVSVPRGLHDMGRQGNMMFAMATSPYMTANDVGQDGSPFSRRLLEGLTNYFDRSLSELFDDVQGKVYIDTSGAQAPEFINGLARAPRWSLALPTVSGGPAIRLDPRRFNIGKLPPFLQSLDRGSLLAFTGGRTSFVDTLFQRRDLLAQAQITSPLRLAYFLATVSYESGNFRLRTEENFNYSASSLRNRFPRLFPTAEIASRYAGNPEKIANRVYAGPRFGNGDEASGDGWRYRGRGYLLITGKYNYRIIGEMIGVDLVAAPDLVNDPEVNLAVALSFWSRQRLNAAADADDIVMLTRRLYGGLVHVGQRMNVLVRAKRALGVPTR
jgi:putative chitinase